MPSELLKQAIKGNVRALVAMTEQIQYDGLNDEDGHAILNAKNPNEHQKYLMACLYGKGFADLQPDILRAIDLCKAILPNDFAKNLLSKIQVEKPEMKVVAHPDQLLKEAADNANPLALMNLAFTSSNDLDLNLELLAWNDLSPRYQQEVVKHIKNKYLSWLPNVNLNPNNQLSRLNDLRKAIDFFKQIDYRYPMLELIQLATTVDKSFEREWAEALGPIRSAKDIEKYLESIEKALSIAERRLSAISMRDQSEAEKLAETVGKNIDIDLNNLGFIAVKHTVSFNMDNDKKRDLFQRAALARSKLDKLKVSYSPAVEKEQEKPSQEHSYESVADLMQRVSAIQTAQAAERLFSDDDDSESTAKNESLKNLEAFFKAANEGRVKEVVSLINKGLVDCNAQDKNGNTVLMLAAKNSHVDLIKTLCDMKGVKATMQNTDHKTAYQLADDPKIARKLLPLLFKTILEDPNKQKYEGQFFDHKKKAMKKLNELEKALKNEDSSLKDKEQALKEFLEKESPAFLNEHLKSFGFK